MSKPFDYAKGVFGGTEYMAKGWHQHIRPFVPKFDNYLSLVIPGVFPHVSNFKFLNKEIICWMHNTPQQFGEDKIEILRNQDFLKRLKYFVVPSQEHKRILAKELPMDLEKIVVIPNAIEPLQYDYNKLEHPKIVKIIHTSSMDRGMDVLLNAVAKVDKRFELEIYNNFNPDIYPELPELDKRITFFGPTPKATVRKAYELSHIHAYPSTFQETFCLSQVESMSAGLLCVTSDIGSLTEVSNGYTRIYPYIEDGIKHSEIFAEHLTKAIEDIEKGNWDPREQIKYVNSEYSWERAKERWIELNDTL